MQIKVSITAEAGAGKSAIASAIRELCADFNIQCELHDDDGGYINEYDLAPALEALAEKKVIVIIETHQLKRGSSKLEKS